MNNLYLKIIIILMIFQSCKNTHKEQSFKEPRTYQQGNSLIKEEYYQNGILKLKKYFTLDTVPKGAEIEYYHNANIAKWKWFDANNKYAYIVIYYDSNGVYESFKGNPFIKAGDYKSQTAIEIVNPPDMNYLVGYRNFCKGRLVEQVAYEPGVTDTTSWVTLDKHIYDSSHKYFLYYYFLSPDSLIIDSAYREIVEGSGQN